MQFHTAVAGITPGNGAFDPGSTSLLPSFPVNSGAEPTVYQEWQSGTFDLNGLAWELIPNGAGGWLGLQRTGCVLISGGFQQYGHGCTPPVGNPSASSTNSSHPTRSTWPAAPSRCCRSASTATWSTRSRRRCSTAASTRSCRTATTPWSCAPLPFGFSFAGGFTNAVGMCSNGFPLARLVGDDGAVLPNVSELLRERPRIAALWTDLDVTAGGQMFCDTVNPNRVVFTWANVAEIGGTGSATFQMAPS